MTVHEQDLTEPTLKLLDSKPNGFMPTRDIIAELEQLFGPTGKDAQIAYGRRDTYFTQKVRNMISHRKSNTSFINRGLAEYKPDKNGLQITAAGRKHISSDAA